MQCRGVALFCVLCACALVGAPTAEASDFSLGVGVGGMLAGIKPHLAVSPQVDISWRSESGLIFGVHDTVNLLVANGNEGLGVFNESAAVLGYATENASIGAGPSFSIYFMPACNAAMTCARIFGLSPGGHAHASLYFAGRLGVSASANVSWVGGSSGALHDDVVGVIVLGPVVRWNVR